MSSASPRSWDVIDSQLATEEVTLYSIGPLEESGASSSQSGGHLERVHVERERDRERRQRVCIYQHLHGKGEEGATAPEETASVYPLCAPGGGRP